MFIQNLNLKQQGILLGTVQKLIAIDGDISEAETDMIEVLKSQCHSSVSAAIAESEDLAAQFPVRREKVSFLLELLGVAYADAEYHEKEKQLIQDVADTLAIPKDELAELNDWVERQLTLVRDAATLMGA